MAESYNNNDSENKNLALFGPNYQDILDQCDSLRQSNLQLREEILRLERENAEIKKKTTADLK
jgi:hypothetical protein